MAKLKVITYPHPVLAQAALSVAQVGREEQRLIKDLIDTMYEEGGVGIAAPQVGVLKRIFIASPNARPGEEVVFVNPKIIAQSGEEIGLEGCLSLPGVSGEIRRAKTIRYEALDDTGRLATGTIGDFLARIFQHELDHLNGKLLIDRVDFDQRQELLSAYQML